MIILSCYGWGISQSLNPTGSIDVHDPVMAKEGNRYYIYHTGVNIPVKTSTNMVNWSNAGVCVNENGTWHRDLAPDRAGNIWAPDISYRDGKWWLYYSVSNGGSPNSVIGLLTSPSLANPVWTNQGVVVSSPTTFPGFEHCSIDPNFVEDTAGNAWLAWGSLRRTNIIQLDRQTGKVPAGALPIRLAQNAAASEQEGVFIVYSRGWYYYFCSWDRCCWQNPTNYNMRFARSRSVTGPYVDRGGVRTLEGGGTLLDDGSGWAGGHAGLYKENGQFYILYHVYRTDTHRSILDIRPIFFDGQDWPTFDKPDRTLICEAENTHYTPAGATTQVETNINFSGGRGITLNANSIGDYIEFQVNVPAPGTYDVKLEFKTNPTRGTYALRIDGVAQGSAVNMITGPGIYNRVKDFGNKTFSTAGTKIYRFTVTGTSGTGFDGSFDAIRLIAPAPFSAISANEKLPRFGLIGGPAVLELCDLSGRTIAATNFSGQLDELRNAFDVRRHFVQGSSIVPGVYILRFERSSAAAAWKIVVKNR